MEFWLAKKPRKRHQNISVIIANLQTEVEIHLGKEFKHRFVHAQVQYYLIINGLKLIILSLNVCKEYKGLKNDTIWRFIASGRKRKDISINFSVLVLIASHFGIK